MKKLRIGVDAIPLVKLNGGIGYYIFHLLDELVRQKKDCLFFLYAKSLHGDIEHFKKYENVRLKKIPFLFRCLHIKPHNIFSILAWIDGIDIFWGGGLFLPLVKRKSMKTIYTIHDFVNLLYPQTMNYLFRMYIDRFTPQFIKNTDFILTNSYGTNERLFQYYGKSCHAVVHPPIKPENFFRNKQEVLPFISAQGLAYNNYVITVGTIEPRKNFQRLIQIYLKILEKHPKEKVWTLVIIGGGGWENTSIKKCLDAAKGQFPDKIKCLGYVPDNDLPIYLAGARCYISLSHYEGYGMPIAEARICGTSVVCTDIPEMREAAENDGIFLKPEDFEAGLERLFISSIYDEAEKKPIKTSYLSNKDSAAKMAAIIDSIQENLNLR